MRRRKKPTDSRVSHSELVDAVPAINTAKQRVTLRRTPSVVRVDWVIVLLAIQAVLLLVVAGGVVVNEVRVYRMGQAMERAADEMRDSFR